MVMKVVMVVEDSARCGILSRELFVIMKAKRAPTAQSMEMMKRQLKIRLPMPLSDRRFPEIKSRLPRRAIEIAVAAEKMRVQKITKDIMISP